LQTRSDTKGLASNRAIKLKLVHTLQA